MQTQIGNRPQHPDYPYDTFAVGDQAHVVRYTDIHPCTVIAVKRAGTEVTVRMDNYALAEGQRPEILPGGYAGHCTNQRDLKYDITANPEGHTETYTLRLWRGRYVWTTKGCRPDGHQRLALGWRAFHDYNF